MNTETEKVLVIRFHAPDPDALPLPGGPEQISQPKPKENKPNANQTPKRPTQLP